MSGNALCLTQRRLTNDHYLKLALRNAREVYKPPVALTRFWKKVDEYTDPDERLEEVVQWLERQAQPGDYVVLEGDAHCVDVVCSYCKDHELIPAAPVWEPHADIQEL
jgi:hypothetical protein